jgi:hypothetical protein
VYDKAGNIASGERERDRFQSFKVSEFQGFKVSEFQGFKVSRLRAGAKAMEAAFAVGSKYWARKRQSQQPSIC